MRADLSDIPSISSGISPSPRSINVGAYPENRVKSNVLILMSLLLDILLLVH